VLAAEAEHPQPSEIAHPECQPNLLESRRLLAHPAKLLARADRQPGPFQSCFTEPPASCKTDCGPGAAKSFL